MATNKIKIQGYLELKLATQFEVERESWGLTHSQALERVFAERYDMEQAQIKPSVLSNGLEQRLQRLEEHLAELAHLHEGLKLIVFGENLLKSDTQQITGDTPSDTLLDQLEEDDFRKVISTEKDSELIICKLYKNNPDHPDSWRYWAGLKQGFVSNLNLAKGYKDEAAIKRQLNQINNSKHAPTTRERISWKPYEELRTAIANCKSAATVGVAS